MLQEKFNNLAVNWFDGMSINKNHFIAQENHLKELYIDSVGQQIHPYNYGLLPLPNGQQHSFEITIDSRKVLHVEITNLRAVTLSGARVEITPTATPVVELKQSLTTLVADEQDDRTFAVVLTVDPFGREPFGNADPQENPPRKPFVVPRYSISLLPLAELSNAEAGLFHLTIGMLSFKNEEFTMWTDYIPPCTSIRSLMMLEETFGRMEKMLLNLEQSVIKIVQKVRTKQQDNTLALTINFLSQNILQFLSNQLPAYSLYLRQQPPVFTIEKIIMLARVIHNSIETWQGNGKEELMNYFTEWCDLNQSMLVKTLAELAELKYQHFDTAQAFRKAESFLRTVVPMFKILSELDYIGKKVDTALFVAEEEGYREGDGRMNGFKSWFKK